MNIGVFKLEACNVDKIQLHLGTKTGQMSV